VNPYGLLKMGALDGLSIGFATKVAEYDDKAGTRKLLEIDLWEVSPVSFPANEDARVDSVKAMTHGDVAAVASSVGKLHGLCSSCEGSDCQGDMLAGLDALCTKLGGGDDGKAHRTPITIRSVERALREAGLSREEAKAVLHGGFKALGLDSSPADDLFALARAMRGAA
jgi:hypothetical protein